MIRLCPPTKPQAAWFLEHGQERQRALSEDYDIEMVGAPYFTTVLHLLRSMANWKWLKHCACGRERIFFIDLCPVDSRGTKDRE